MTETLNKRLKQRFGRRQLRAVDKAMQRPATYPHPAGRIERIETHISIVYLAGRFAYKIKKPVDLGFVDFSRVSARSLACEDECRLNRRLAPRIYLRVVPIVRRGRGLRIKGAGVAVEHAVMMRRFDNKRIFAHLIDAGALNGDTIERTATDIASFHRCASRIPPRRVYGTSDFCASQLRSVLNDLRTIAPRLISKELTDWCEAELLRLERHFEQRRAQEFVRECHGDLHLQNIVLQGKRPLIFDCIEFDAGLRWIDVVSDVAFFVMDLEAHGRNDLGARALSAWLLATGDYAGLQGWRFYVVYRALVRALVESLKRHADEARRYVRTASIAARGGSAYLLLCHGYSGSGKSAASAALAHLIGAVRIVSDIERKRVTPLVPPRGGRLPAEAYDPAAIDRHYEHLLELTCNVLDAGMAAIVDATFLLRAHRERFMEVASVLRVPVLILDFVAPRSVLFARVASRACSQDGPSDADVVVLKQQLLHAEPLERDEQRITETFQTNIDLDAFQQRAFWHSLQVRLHQIRHQNRSVTADLS
ncbi:MULTISPECIES: AAA family ATPase [unclassified Caballeronia]|uniref:bifunctional aminoglycoside phosphotransferase/ATP-binding protein n=1 Tax=unclassified Caballeronia TaxID=2646786 RepID=UPI0020289C0A|nr:MULTISPECIES: AAA family ATPase [unclassified Caballeronia]